MDEGSSAAETQTTRTDRRWLPWTVVGGVTAVAVAAAFVVVPGLLDADAPAEALPPSPVATTTPTETPTPTPAPSCIVSPASGSWHDPRAIDLPASGDLTTTLVTEAAAEYVSPHGVDDERLALIAQGPWPEPATLYVVDRATRAVAWDRELASSGYLAGTPETMPIDDILISEFVGTDDVPETRLTAVSPRTGEVRVERTFAGDTIAVIRPWPAAGDWRPGADWPLVVSTRDAAMGLDPSTLEPRWTVTGEEYGVGWFEGGVPFDLTGDVLFVGGHAVDAGSGQSLGWRIEGRPVPTAGHVLWTPIIYDSVDPYDLAGLDLRTGETCWSTEVLSVASDASRLFVVTSAGQLLLLDPATGEVLEDRGEVGDVRLELAGDVLMLAPRLSPDLDGAGTSTLITPEGTWTTELPTSAGPLAASGSQPLVRTGDSVEAPGRLLALDPATGEEAWSIIASRTAEGVFVDTAAGVLVRTQKLPEGRLRIELLH